MPELEVFLPSEEVSSDEEPLPSAAMSQPEEDPDLEPESEIEPQDLTILAGIGPKMASILQDAEIQTYAQLAAKEIDEINQLLEESDPRLARLADVGYWRMQAAKAASGDWEGLDVLQQAYNRFD